MKNLNIPAVKNPIFQTLLEVRINDINYGNHLGHDSLISLLHEARVRFLKHLGYSELNIEGLGILITHLAVDYISQAFYSDKILINIEIGDHSNSSIKFFYQAINQTTKKEIARALTIMTFYDYKKSKVAKIPQGFLASLSNS